MWSPAPPTRAASGSSRSRRPCARPAAGEGAPKSGCLGRVPAPLSRPDPLARGPRLQAELARVLLAVIPPRVEHLLDVVARLRERDVLGDAEALAAGRGPRQPLV